MSAVLREVFGGVWVDVIGGLGGIVLVHVAALADIVPTLSGDVGARACLFA